MRIHNIILIIFLFPITLCQCVSTSDYCSWYRQDMTFNELKHNGCPFCGKFLCTRFGYLQEIKSCFGEPLEPCQDGTLLQEHVDYDKPYPGCCPTYKCVDPTDHLQYAGRPYSYDHHLYASNYPDLMTNHFRAFGYVLFLHYMFSHILMV